MDQEKAKFEVSLGPAEIKRANDFINRYANHVQVQSSLWDMKILFGQLDQSIGRNTVVQDTAITMPWTQLKVFSYILQQQLIAHQLQNGRIVVPQGIIPPVSEVPDDVKEQFPVMIKVHDALKALQDEFYAANPEAQ